MATCKIQAAVQGVVSRSESAQRGACAKTAEQRGFPIGFYRALVGTSIPDRMA